MKRAQLVSLGIIASYILSAGASVARACDCHAKKSEAQAAPVSALSGESLYQLGSRWVSQDGKKLRLEDLQGKITVAAMVFTHCKTACPLTVRDLRKIEEGLPSALRENVRFVLFSFDPERDTPEQLKAFTTAHGLDSSRWLALSGEATDVRSLAAALGVQYKKNARGEFDHTNLITVLDSGGVIRHQEAGLGAPADRSLAAIQALQSR